MAIEPSDAASPPPPRPTRFADLKFTPQPAVQWFSPPVLADAGLRVAISSGFGAFLDKRELQAHTAVEDFDHSQRADGIWIDYIADTGDGFNATYTVAWLTSQPELPFPDRGLRLPRGKLVIFGGDEVYPVGNPDSYESKFTRPFEASLPWLPTDNPELYAIPGNHDWYDGLTSFFRVFGQKKWVGGRITRQTRSYWAIRLPHRWWLWGIDIQLDSYIDTPQLDYFEGLPVQPGDAIVLCTATPSWIDGPQSRGFKNLAYLERRVIAGRGAHLVLSLSGDSHHYAHHVGEDGTHKVTAGGGGAFLHPTHVASSDPLRLPVGTADQGGGWQLFNEAATFPSRTASRRLALGAVNLPLRNWTFVFVPAVVYILLGWSSQFSLRAFGGTRQDFDDAAVGFGLNDVFRGLFTNPVSLLILVIFGCGLIGFAKGSPQWSAKAQKVAKWPMGLAHLTLHVVAVVTLGLLAVKVVSWIVDGGFWFTVLLLLIMGALGGLVGSFVTGLYLGLSCALLNAHGNDTFSAMRLTSYKNFLRLHLDADGVLHVYPIGIRRSCRTWQVPEDPNRSPSASWIAPRPGTKPGCELIEEPFVVVRPTP